MNEKNLPRQDFKWAVALHRPSTGSKISAMFHLPDFLNEELNYVSAIELNGACSGEAMQAARFEVFERVNDWAASWFPGWNISSLTAMSAEHNEWQAWDWR